MLREDVCAERITVLTEREWVGRAGSRGRQSANDEIAKAGLPLLLARGTRPKKRRAASDALSFLIDRSLSHVHEQPITLNDI